MKYNLKIKKYKSYYKNLSNTKANKNYIKNKF